MSRYKHYELNLKGTKLDFSFEVVHFWHQNLEFKIHFVQIVSAGRLLFLDNGVIYGWLRDATTSS